LGQSGQSSQSSQGGSSRNARGGAGKSGAGKGSGGKRSAGKSDAADRPGASGHRFGPDLACSECGILWDVHQRDPKPCQTEAMKDAFARRPSGDFDSNPALVATGETTKED